MRHLILSAALLFVTTNAFAQTTEAQPEPSSTAAPSSEEEASKDAPASAGVEPSPVANEAASAAPESMSAPSTESAPAPAASSEAGSATADATVSVTETEQRSPRDVGNADVEPPSGCAARRGALGEGPIALGYYEADMATGRRVCPRTEVSLGGRMGATIDTPDFYGGLDGYVLLGGSYAFNERLEGFATLEAFRYVFITNAVIEATDMGLGQLTAGVSYGTLRLGDLNGALSVRVMLPTEVIGGQRAQPPFISNARTFGVELGHAFTWDLLSTLEAHAYVGGDLTTAGLGAQGFPRLGGLLNAGVQYSPLEWFGVVLDVNGRIGGYTSYLAPAAGLRFQIARVASLEVAGSLPLLGTDRHDAVLGLRFGYRL